MALSKQQLKGTQPEVVGVKRGSFGQQFVAGAIAGVTEVICMYPLDLVKTRLQLQTPSSRVHYSGVIDCFRKIMVNEGARTLYRGCTPPILMEAPKR